MTEQAEQVAKGAGPIGALVADLPTDRLMKEFEDFLGAVAERAVAFAADKVGGVTERLTGYAEKGGSPAGKAAATGARALGQGKSPVRALMTAGMSGIKEKIGQAAGGGGGDNGGKKLKVTNIVEQIDVGVPVDVAYNLWTRFRDFPSFMKKVENVEQEDDEKLTWKAQVLWSHRTWRSTITEQVPDERIIWQSEGDKGYVDGAVTFHEITPDLTRILVVLEYHPQGFFERTGNIWRAQGRRVRLELKHFRRQIMTQAILHPDEVEGWRGEIRDGEVVRAHGEQGEQEPADGDSVTDGGDAQAEDQAEAGDEYGDDLDDEYDEDDQADDASAPPEDRDADEGDQAEPEDEYEQDEEPSYERGYEDTHKDEGGPESLDGDVGGQTRDGVPRRRRSATTGSR